MNSNHAADDRHRTRKSLIHRGIEQACRRRLSSDIHSGVRVKVRGKLSASSEPTVIESRNSHPNDQIQSMLKRLWVESETSALTERGQKSVLTSNSPLRGSFHSSLLRDVGVQTNSVLRIDRQTSCEKITSLTSRSDTTRSEENSSQSEHSSQETLSSSTASTSASEDEQVYASYQRNHNRNNNALENVPTDDPVTPVVVMIS